MLITAKYKSMFVIFETDDDFAKLKSEGGIVKSVPRQHTFWFEAGVEPVIHVDVKDAWMSTVQEIDKYIAAKKHYEQSSSSLIWDAGGLMLGNYIRRSNDNYWAPQFKGTIVKMSIDEMILVDTQVPRGIYEYIDLDDEWLDQFGFYVDRKVAHIKYNRLGNIFQLNKLNQYAGVTDQNSAQIEAGITNGTIPLTRYEFTWGAVHIRHVHKLQNIFSELTGQELTRKDGKR